jgi:hypothetical protein
MKKFRNYLAASVGFLLFVGVIGLTLTRNVHSRQGMPDTDPPVIQACYGRITGIVRIVESASQCHNQERPITWNQQGVPGEQGPTGAQGPQGPAGRARAAGAVFTGTELQFYPQGLTGWVAVERIRTGTYCLTPDPSITLHNSVLIVTPGSLGAGGGGGDEVYWTGVCGQNPFKFAVETRLNGQPSDAVHFTAMVP